MSEGVAKRFWEEFGVLRERLSGDESDEQVDLWLDEVIEALGGVHPDLSAVVSSIEGGCRELIVTARDDESLFPLVDDLIHAAPRIEGWRFIALSPPLGWDFVHDRGSGSVRASELLWENLGLPRDPKRFGVRVLFPPESGFEGEDLDDIARVIVRTGLGERESSTWIGFIEGVFSEPPIDRESLLELTDLTRFVAWWSARTGS